MVRLLLELEDARSVYEGLFQSHNGAIAAAGHCRYLQGLSHRFNPTMVRLLHFISSKSTYKYSSFNPTMVRLLLGFPAMTQVASKVSIPQWCDCC